MGAMKSPLVYVAQVLGFEDRDPKRKGWVWRLNKFFYGTKQAPRMWKEHPVESLALIGFIPVILDNALFHNAEFSILLHMHVYDGLVVGKSRRAIRNFLDQFRKIYSSKVNERPKQNLGYTFDWRKDGLLYIHQSDFAQKIIDDFNMAGANPVKAPSPLNFQSLVASEADPFNEKYMQKAIGVLTYLALHTRPDIALTLNVLAHFTAFPNESHWLLVKHLVCYLCGAN
jgi:hypothetical protein